MAGLGWREMDLRSATKASPSAYDFDFAADDLLLFGKESEGVPSGQVRAMNLAMSVGLPLGEALCQPAEANDRFGNVRR